MWYKNASTSFFRLVTMHAVSDRRTERPSQSRVLHCSRAVKTTVTEVGRGRLRNEYTRFSEKGPCMGDLNTFARCQHHMRLYTDWIFFCGKMYESRKTFYHYIISCQIIQAY